MTKTHIKGMIHALLVPILVALIVSKINIHYSLLAGLMYLVIPATVYRFKKEEEGRRAFYMSLGIVIGFLSFYVLIVLLSAL